MKRRTGETVMNFPLTYSISGDKELSKTKTCVKKWGSEADEGSPVGRCFVVSIFGQQNHEILMNHTKHLLCPEFLGGILVEQCCWVYWINSGIFKKYRLLENQ